MDVDGGQMDIPVGQNLNSSSDNAVSNSIWNGFQIKDILEKIDLFNVKIENPENDLKEKVLVGNKMINTSKLNKTVVSTSKPEDAFLGPKLWDKSFSIPVNTSETEESEFSIMNIEDFLNENNLTLGNEDENDTAGEENIDCTNGYLDHENDSNSDSGNNNLMRAVSVNEVEERSTQVAAVPANEFLYAESKRAKMEREREERKRNAMESIEIDFAPEDLALATIPGAKFDPRERAFSRDELKPQPIIRKRKKQYVQQESKDGKYWEKRLKNNFAARRSREARRLKENQIALRAAFLEKENLALKTRVEEVTRQNEKLALETKLLRESLKRFEG